MSIRIDIFGRFDFLYRDGTVRIASSTYPYLN